jgi:hypothetical protein
MFFWQETLGSVFNYFCSDSLSRFMSIFFKSRLKQKTLILKGGIFRTCEMLCLFCIGDDKDRYFLIPYQQVNRRGQTLEEVNTRVQTCSFFNNFFMKTFTKKCN